MTLWSSPHTKESATLSLGHPQQSTEAGKIKELADAGNTNTLPIMPSSVRSFSSDGSEDAGFEDGNIDVDMADDEADGIQIPCIQSMMEYEPMTEEGHQGTGDSTVMSDLKSAIPLPPPPMQIESGTAYGGNQAYGSIEDTIPGMMDQRQSSNHRYFDHSGSTIPMTETGHSFRARGDVGLNNIGNTCFMNSGLQCLLHTSRFVEYFVGSTLPFDSKVSSLAYQLHGLVMHAWFGSANTIALHDFKMVLGIKLPQFKDCRQHDCQEFLTLFIDLLHEELKLKNKPSSAIADSSVSESCVEQSARSSKKATNANPSSSSTHTSSPVYKRLKLEHRRNQTTDLDSTNWDGSDEEDVKRKTAVGQPESRSQPDSVARSSVDTDEELVDVENIENEAEVNSHAVEDAVNEDRVLSLTERAEKYWEDMLENGSAVTSTFAGIFHSAITCTECGFVSEKHDPFQYLALSIPRVMDKQLIVTFISMKDRSPTKIDLTYHLMGTVDKLIQEVVNKVDSCIWDDRTKFAAAEVVNHRVTRVLDEKLQLRSLNTNSRNIYVFELNDNFDDKLGAGNGSYPYFGNQPSSSCKTAGLKKGDWGAPETCTVVTSDVAASTSTSTYKPVWAPVGGGAYDTTAASSSFSPGVSSSSDDPTLQQDNDNFNKVQCNICLEDYSKNDLKQHRGCSCVLCEECLMKSVEHFQADDQEKPKGDSYVKCAVCLKTVECKQAFVSLEESAAYSSPPEFITMPILFRNEPGTDANNNSPWISGLFGSPWLIRVPSQMNALELVEYLENINPVPEADYKLLSVKYDGKGCGQCVFASRCSGCVIPREGTISLNSTNSIMISYTGLSSELISDLRPSDMAIHNELSDSWSQTRNDEPPIDIHDCLRTFSETEFLELPYPCPVCKKNQRATKAISICKFPDYLIVHLKRFVFLDPSSSNKLNNRLTFPINDLDVSDYVTKGFSTNVEKYNLYSCVCHFGSMSVGHYTAYAKNPLTSKWHYFNDDTITERAPGDNEHTSAYVLFYEKQGIGCNIPTKCVRPIPELNNLKASSTTYGDTKGKYLSNDCPGPVRLDFVNETNLQVDSTSPNFNFPHTSTESDLLALEVDEGVGNESAQLSEIRDGLGLAESDSTAVTSSTSAPEDGDADLQFNNSECDVDDSSRGQTEEMASSSTTTQHPELSSSSSVGGADSTSN